MPGEGLQEGLRRMLLGFVPVYVHLAQVVKVVPNDDFGFLLDVIVRPDERELQARPVYVGSGDGIGFFWPVAVDDEVLVLIPEGDPNRAVAIIGLTSRPAKPPAVFDNSKPILVHPSGLELRTTALALVETLVKGDGFLADFDAFLTAVDLLFYKITSTATTAPQIAAAAVTLQADARYIAFLARVKTALYKTKAMKSE